MAITEFKISGVKGTVSFFAGVNSSIMGRDVKGDRVVMTLDPSTRDDLFIFSPYICIIIRSTAATEFKLKKIRCFFSASVDSTNS